MFIGVTRVITEKRSNLQRSLFAFKSCITRIDRAYNLYSKINVHMPYHYFLHYLRRNYRVFKKKLSVQGRLKGGGNRGNVPPGPVRGGNAPPPLANENKKHTSKDKMKIKENLKTCALKKVYIKKEHDKSRARALKIKIGF